MISEKEVSGRRDREPHLSSLRFFGDALVRPSAGGECGERRSALATTRVIGCSAKRIVARRAAVRDLFELSGVGEPRCRAAKGNRDEGMERNCRWRRVFAHLGGV